jgi:hypothetical protein
MRYGQTRRKAFRGCPIDCDCPEGLEGTCEACQREQLEQGIENAMLEAEEGAEQD